MIEAKRPAEHSPLGEGIGEHRPDALSHMAETVFCFAHGQEAKTLKAAPAKK
jgi:hypothetical protein